MSWQAEGLVLALPPIAIANRNKQLLDFSGYGNHAQWPGGTSDPTWGFDNQRGPSLVYDGSNDYLEVAHDTTISPTSQMSIFCWCKQDGLAVNESPLMRGTYTGPSWAWAVQTNNSDSTSIRVFITDALDDGGSNHGSTPTSSWSADEWHHLGFVFDGGGASNAARLKVYIDGVSQSLSFSGTIPTSLQVPSEGLQIGRFLGLGREWHGNIADVSMRSGALSSSEVLQLYEAETRDELYRLQFGYALYVSAAGTILPQMMQQYYGVYG